MMRPPTDSMKPHDSSYAASTSAMVTRGPGCTSSVPAPEAMTAPGIVFASATERLISSLADDHGKPIPRCEVSIASATARPSDHTWRRKASVASQSSATSSVGSKIGRAHVELQSHSDLVCRLLLEKKNHRHPHDARVRLHAGHFRVAVDDVIR